MRAAVKLFLIFLILHGSVALLCQEAESNAVRLRLSNLPGKDGREIPDTLPPSISLLMPDMATDTFFQSDVDEIDLLGEVKDESRIRFVSVNNEIRVVNETGVFATTLRLSPGENQVRIRAMDEYNNLRDLTITIEYIAPIVTLADKIRSGSTYYGLIIGINDYMDQDIPDLDNPIKDADAIYRTLTGKYTFDPENIIMLKNPKRFDIIRELDKLRTNVTSDDNLLIFYQNCA